MYKRQSQYAVNLNGQTPSGINVETATQVVEVLGFTFEIDLAITTFTWTLPNPTDQVLIELEGALDLHDSVDAFVLDLETVISAKPLPLTAPDISLADGQITVSWPIATGGTLQLSSDLSASEPWADVTTPPTVADETNSLSFPLSLQATFFRLRNP